MRSLLQFLRIPQPSDRERRYELENLQAEATQLQASLAGLDAAILRSWSEAGDLADRTLAAELTLAGVRARNRALRASLNLNDWQPVVMLLLTCGATIVGPLALAIAVAGSAP